METKIFKNWYLTRPEAISRFLHKVFTDWGYRVIWNPSDDSESQYLLLCPGTDEDLKPLNIRISNHSVSSRNIWISYDVDVYGGFEREGATSYVKLIVKLSEKMEKPLPPVMEKIGIGTDSYKRYRMEMQRRKKNVRKPGKCVSCN